MNTFQIDTIENTSELKKIARNLANRQKNDNFVRFLKEKPMSIEENLNRLESKLKNPHAKIFSITTEWENELLWVFFLHNFSAENKSLELWWRINPKKQQKWLWSRSIKQITEKTLSKWEITQIETRHSALNKWSFWTMRNNNFTIDNFIEKQTFLTNSNIRTDDFRWTKSSSEKEIMTVLDEKKSELKLNTENNKQILFWLNKHSFISSNINQKNWSKQDTF